MRRKEEAIAMLERWRQSGKSKLAFARDAGISITTFHRWFKLYGHLPTSQAATFVEVPEAAPPALRTPQPTGDPAGATARIRLELPDGLVVLIY